MLETINRTVYDNNLEHHFHATVKSVKGERIDLTDLLLLDPAGDGDITCADSVLIINNEKHRRGLRHGLRISFKIPCQVVKWEKVISGYEYKTAKITKLFNQGLDREHNPTEGQLYRYKRLVRNLARKEKGSSNWQKQNSQIQGIRAQFGWCGQNPGPVVKLTRAGKKRLAKAAQLEFAKNDADAKAFAEGALGLELGE